MTDGSRFSLGQLFWWVTVVAAAFATDRWLGLGAGAGVLAFWLMVGCYWVADLVGFKRSPATSNRIGKSDKTW